MNKISSSNMTLKTELEKTLTTWSYVFDRRGFEVEVLFNDVRGIEGRILTLPSRWGSETMMELKFNTLSYTGVNVSVCVTGTTLPERAKEWGLEDFVTPIPEEKGWYVLEMSGNTSRAFFERIVQHSFEELEVLSILQYMNVQNYQELEIKTPEFLIIQKAHKCEECEDHSNQCWSDNDGVLKDLETGKEYQYHITCERVIQVIREDS